MPSNRNPALLLCLITLVLSLAATIAFDRGNAHTSVFTLSNFVGPTTASLLHGQGLVVCSDGMGTLGNPICYHSARMPVASAVVALGDLLFGDHYLSIALFKAVLLLLPLWAAIVLVFHRLPTHGTPRLLTSGLLLLPFLLTPFLADVVNLQVEEGYAYSLLALALALVLFPWNPGRRSIAEAVLFSLTVALLYLSKSSMAPAVAVLTAAFLWPVRRSPLRLALTLLLVLAAPFSWALWQHHASGRYTFGTSLDGMNLHKGNNPDFLLHYPPPPNTTLDQFDPDLNHGHFFPNEWAFNDFHQHAAVDYIRHHPSADAIGALQKLDVAFLSVHKFGSQTRAGLMEHIESLGILLFRLLLWTSCIAAVFTLARSASSPSHRFASGAYLALLAGIALPYVLGFAYTRHVSVLIYPAVLLCCQLLQPAPTPAIRPR